MRLSKIKLAGFKTFVDPTTVEFPSNLLGVVGPNGCGKSNIIDAVRWVMGESSAKNLRGDELTDVIFNGSSARKPVGTATIELLFDNADGAIGGQFASYAEVSIKRVMSRDGASAYYLNNTRCRRKDITAVFLGTGLGPRSYAIIEQGMISRIIEAKPEELRVYLEEAAGISKYKARRRETTNRIRHTRDNLSRLNDLREEIESQLRKLKRQAGMAKRYQNYKEKQRRTNAELVSLRLAEMQDRETAEAKLTREKETALEASVARQRAVETEIEKARSQHAEESDAFNKVQERFYKVGAEIARLEQLIQHSRDLRQRLAGDVEEAEAGMTEFQGDIERDERRLAELDGSLEALEPEWRQRSTAAEEAEAAWRAAEQSMDSWQSQWEGVHRDSSESEQSASVERTRIEHLEQQLEALVSRQERIEVERSALSVAELNEELTRLASDAGQHEARLIAQNQSLDGTTADIARRRNEDLALTSRLDEQRVDLQEVKGRLASLEALQQAALGQRRGAVTDWLQGAGLADRPRLGQELDVEPGWERAVETVLGDYLEAVCVNGIDGVSSVIENFDGGSVTLLEETAASDVRGGGIPLTSKLRGTNRAGSLLAGVRVAGNLGEALRVRRELSTGESVVTADGLWLGRDWLRVNREEDAHAGVIAREQEIRELTQRRARLQASAEELAERHEAARASLRELEARRDREQDDANRIHRARVDVIAALDARRARLEDMSSRISELASDADVITQQIGDVDGELGDARGRLNTATTSLADVRDLRQRLENQQEGVRSRLEETRATHQRARAAAHELEVRVESQRSTRESAKESLTRLQEQLIKLAQRREELREQIAGAEAPLAQHQDELNANLQSRLTIEAELTAARKALEGTDSRVRHLEQERVQCEQDVAVHREAVEQVRISAQEIKTRRDTLAEQFQNTGYELVEIRDGLPEDATVEGWEENLEKAEQRIARLGPINLAAIDEFNEQSERKEYLDAQFADLTEALETLEKAIRKIDRETRTRFSETYEKVNDAFKRLFPKLFGGGHAYLELSDNDLLTAGVTVMARPPGKRNSTIHLLSGGEKALTAVALVFAIFELNPAPFCMLDEVDAPLDDANVGRFCNILQSMSDQVQFVFITHNKHTISLADHLLGVTMQEAGVSRLVSVDIDAAVELAEAS